MLAGLLCGVAATAMAASAAEGVVRLVGVEEVTLEWMPASGPVDGYLVLAAHDGGDFALARVVSVPRATLDVVPGEEIAVRVQAFGRRPDGATIFGPRSDASELVRIERPPGFTATGLWMLHCASCRSLSLQTFSASRPLAQPFAPGQPWLFAGLAQIGPAAVRTLWWEPFQDLLLLWNLATQQPAAVIHGPALADLRPVPPADLDGDGVDELLLRNTVTGALEIRRAADPQGAEGAAELAASRSAQLTTGDVDGDGRSEIVWHDPASGHVVLWQMEALAVADATVLGAAPAASILAFAADFDGDGRDDLLWRAPDGSLSVWYLGSGAVRGTAALPSAEGDEGRWVVGAADFDGRPGAEIALQDFRTGAVEVVHPQGLAARVLVLTPGSKWRVIGVRN